MGRLLPIALILVLASQGIARAQDATSAEGAGATPTVSAEARAHLDRGDQLFEAGGFDAAIAEYDAAYDAMEGHPSRHLVLFNLAQCYERLTQYDLALTNYRRYLEEGGASEDDAAEVRGRISVLEGLLGTVVITLTWPEDVPEAERPAVEVWVAERHVADGEGELSLPGGNHTIEVHAVGFDTQLESVTLAAGARTTVTFTMRVTARPSGLPPAVFVGTTIATALAIIAGASLGGYALARHDQLASLPMAMMAERTTDAISEMKDYALVADVMYGTAALFGTASIVLFFATDWSSHDDEAATPPATAFRLVPVASPSWSGLWVEGSF